MKIATAAALLEEIAADAAEVDTALEVEGITVAEYDRMRAKLHTMHDAVAAVYTLVYRDGSHGDAEAEEAWDRISRAYNYVSRAATGFRFGPAA